MNPSNWITRFDDVYGFFRELAATHWELAAVLAFAGCAFAAIVAAKSPERAEAMKRYIRAMRYCNYCGCHDLATMACSIGCENGATCALVDKTSGRKFEIKEIV